MLPQSTCMYMYVCVGEGGEEGEGGVCVWVVGCDCVDVGVIVWVCGCGCVGGCGCDCMGEGVCGCDGLDCCCKVHVCVSWGGERERGRESVVCVCVCVCVCVGGCGCDCMGEEGSVWVGQP